MPILQNINTKVNGLTAKERLIANLKFHFKRCLRILRVEIDLIRELGHKPSQNQICKRAGADHRTVKKAWGYTIPQILGYLKAICSGDWEALDTVLSKEQYRSVVQEQCIQSGPTPPAAQAIEFSDQDKTRAATKQSHDNVATDGLKEWVEVAKRCGISLTSRAQVERFKYEYEQSQIHETEKAERIKKRQAREEKGDGLSIPLQLHELKQLRSKEDQICKMVKNRLRDLITWGREKKRHGKTLSAKQSKLPTNLTIEPNMGLGCYQVFTAQMIRGS